MFIVISTFKGKLNSKHTYKNYAKSIDITLSTIDKKNVIH